MTQPKKHILILCSYFFPYVSGVSEYARLLAETLAKSHKVTVLTAQHKKHLPSEETIDGYRICRAKPLMFIDKGYISIDLRGIATSSISTFRCWNAGCSVC
jgi:hypothetical protein